MYLLYAAVAPAAAAAVAGFAKVQMCLFRMRVVAPIM
jgi:hypothetical protein